MSARRKNAGRLKRLRAAGVPINGDYLITKLALRTVPRVPAALPGLLAYGVVDQRRRVVHVSSSGQRAMLEALR